ncbi:DUF6583 family protein [Lentibacillus sp. L22]|uniref:DUF6583 family protein n=1 Tax=Lentibacillus TaxID=175304 RepID=UPI0022B13F52|nr:DUF6583 family protein [Lentibacillus daqui]
MEETQNGDPGKKGISKKLIAIIVVIVLLIGGGITAYALLTGSDKAQYFKAEKGTFDFMKDQLSQRYEPELDWSKQTKENPTETAFELSGEYNNPSGGYGMMDPSDIINNSTLNLTAQTDLEKKQLYTDMKASVGGLEIKDLNFYLDADQLMVGLPFLDENLQIKDKDVGKLIHEADPTFPEGETIDFDAFFEMAKGLPEKDADYLKKEYLTEIYKDLPGDAFESTKETIKVDGKNFNTKKLTFHLSEQETKDLLVSILEKVQGDKKLQKIFKEQMEIQTFGIDPSAFDMDFDENIDFDEAIDNMFGKEIDKGIKEIKEAHIPNGFTSDIWAKNDLIVKRDFSIGVGENKDDTNTLSVKGTNLLSDTQQKFDYKITGSDDTDKEAITLTGDLSWKDNKANDSIKLVAPDETKLSYQGKETLKDEKRDFERVFSVTDPYNDNYSLNWSGNASYDHDKMSSENNFSVDAPDINQDAFSLTVAKDAKTIKKVKTPDTSNVKDIGSMSIDEIEDYFETDVAPQYQKWIMGILGAGGGLNGL